MFTRILRLIQRSQMRRAEYWQLHNMSDKMLKDIGITRGEIQEKFYQQQKVYR
tara:strand:- start:37 stop:195 length:159 start_codon:yes stop_codon:yes gene_type:complete